MMTDLHEEISNSLAGQVWQSVKQFPDRPALELGDRQYAYLELYRAAASITRAILDLDDPNPFVAVMADKSFTCYAGILGVLMAGKAYLPLNPRFPASRNLFMLEKARIRVFLAGDYSDEELEKVLDNYTGEIFIIFPEETGLQENEKFLPKIVSPDDPAYLLFTSGTTGQPKGVAVSNGNVTSYLNNIRQKFDFGTGDRFTQNFDLTFDLSVHDIFLAWSTGACLLVPDDNSSFAMSRFIRENQPTVWFSVPSVVKLMDRMRLLKPGAFPSIRLSFFCGEALMAKTALAWQKAVPQSGIINLYGPTEATIAISSYELPEDSKQWKTKLGIVSIGQLFEGNSYILLKENPTADNGELCLAGPQVVSGYFENEQADRAFFFHDDLNKINFYKTGDIVCADAFGNLFYLGRKDTEVKISGFRVNLKEIENHLEQSDKVSQSVVVFDQSDAGDGILIAFILGEFEDHLEAENKLDEFCRRHLPWYMIPGKFIFVKDIPLNTNGKTDKDALIRNYYHGK